MSKKINNWKDFSLVLSGGGALGISHLGILKNLEEKNLIPKEIIGTSMGGIIGACFSIGLEEHAIFKIIEEFSSITKWIKFSMNGNSIIKSDKIEKIFKNIFDERKMKDTNIPLKLICTNLLNGNERILDSKDDIYIKDALLATMAIPGIFEEKLIDNIPYGDGFLTNNLPINHAFYKDILAIDVLGNRSFEDELPNNFFKTKNVLEMFERSMRILIFNQANLNLRNIINKNIIIITPNVTNYKTFHFNKFKELRNLGLNLLPI